MAAGLQIREDKIADFQDAFEQEIQRTISPETLVPVLQIDGELDFAAISDDLIDELELLNQGIVQFHRQVGRQAKRTREISFQSVLKIVAILQQTGAFCLDVLPELIDLHEVNDPGVQVGLQQRQGAELQFEAVFGVANALQRL